VNKSDYDKYYKKKGGTYVIPVEVFNELFDELERLSFNYEQALEDLDKKDNIINELEKYLIEQVEKSYSNDYDNVLDKLDELKGSDKE
jgi:uncharacterized Zn finger protein